MAHALRFYGETITAMYWLSTRLSSMYFKQLCNHIDRFRHQVGACPVPDEILLMRLQNWSEIHLQICTTVSDLESCFGSAMLTNLCFLAISCLTSSYNVFRCFWDGECTIEKLSTLLHTIHPLLHVWFLTYAADQIDSQVSLIVKNIFRSHKNQ